ncbi:helix-turn-helix domain-containing protein [Halomonas sp. ML-15]|uniref:helix-turn-helix domain-containing protein n=1 Tax=Halomonas sp. ML-15 TaxID=2773305 RepID=UPI001CD126B3|nr:helix-turn-helix domain-containing protein [Halomonas sp. ML-15]
MQGHTTFSEAAPRLCRHCEVLVVGALLQQLLLASAEVPARYDKAGRNGVMMRLILHELRDAATLLLFAALPKLTAGASITAVALELGYDSPSAFSTMFRRALGQPPPTFVASSPIP